MAEMVVKKNGEITMNNSVHAFTSITSNYLPKARVLAESVKRVNPEVKFHLLLSDDLPDGFNLDEEHFDNIIYAESLPIKNAKGWIFSHSVVELCTAVKGLGVEYIFDTEKADKVFYFDPDIAVFSRIEDLCDNLESSDIILTPHQTTPESSIEAIMDNEMASLKYGVFNLGFLGVKNSDEGRRFSRWWRDRLLSFCHDDLERGLFTDQKWVNLAPCFFKNIGVIHSPAFNVATWNISTRTVKGEPPYDLTVNGEPLGFYHFSGFDSGAQEIMLKKYAANSPVLFDLRKWYIEKCKEHGQENLGAIPSKYHAYEDGTVITKAERLLYRQRLDLQRAFPDPFLSSSESYQNWYLQNIDQGEAGEDSNYKIIHIPGGASFADVLSDFTLYLDFYANGSRNNAYVRRSLVRILSFILKAALKLRRF